MNVYREALSACDRDWTDDEIDAWLPPWRWWLGHLIWWSIVYPRLLDRRVGP